MNNKKLKLKKLQVNSFISDISDDLQKTVNGGSGRQSWYPTACGVCGTAASLPGWEC